MSASRLADLLRRRRDVFVGTLSVLAMLALPASVVAGDTRKVFAMDRCEPDSFNAAIEPGACVRNGGVTFDKFARRLNPKDGGHNAWRFSRHDVTLTPGQSLSVRNTGGEVHTFTEVVDFGAGFVPELNAALPAGTPPAQPIGSLGFIAAGESLQVGPLSAGTYRFECLIHPWMRTVVDQQPG
jgi:plastocyanin